MQDIRQSSTCNNIASTEKLATTANATTISGEHPLWLKNFIRVYQALSTENLHRLESIYHNEVIFIDPIHQVEGFDNLHHYFTSLYQNLAYCDFVIEQAIVQNSSAAIYWKMTYQHTKLNKGNTVTIIGTSHIKGQDDKVIYHRDYLDVGAMLYEQIPVLGKLILWIKKQAAK